MASLEDLTAEARHSAAIEALEFNIVATLKPRIFIDGNQWCVLYGNNVQDGIAGFGGSPILAVYAFNKAWHEQIQRPADTIPICKECIGTGYTSSVYKGRVPCPLCNGQHAEPDGGAV